MNNEQLPAYPFVEQGTAYESVSVGLTKLEAFTMAAMQGLCACPIKSDEVFPSPEAAWAEVAKHAVMAARATLTELSKQQ